MKTILFKAGAGYDMLVQKYLLCPEICGTKFYTYSH